MGADTWIHFSSLYFLWIMSNSFANCYEQLINTRTTKVTSSSIHPFASGRGYAGFTIDGNFNQHYTNCMHTAIGWSEAWLTIDLGDIYNVKGIKIWYRDEVCNNGWYGKECQELCGYCRGHKPCHHVTGSCSELCEPGYSGEKCDDSEFPRLLEIQRKMLNTVRELLSFKRQRIGLIANGTSPTDLK